MVYKSPACKCGDVNGDGYITMEDYELAAKMLGVHIEDKALLNRADLNRNGVVDTEDLEQIFNVATGKSDFLVIKGNKYMLKVADIESKPVDADTQLMTIETANLAHSAIENAKMFVATSNQQISSSMSKSFSFGLFEIGGILGLSGVIIGSLIYLNNKR